MRTVAIVLLAGFAIGGTAEARTRRKPHQTTKHTYVPKAKRSRSKRNKVRRVSYEPAMHGQTSITPERYKEIQSALASKGYFPTEPNGRWGPESVEALRRFQADQNLKVDGKVGSLTLIALGLGPKRATTVKAKPAEPPVDEPQSVVVPR